MKNIAPDIEKTGFTEIPSNDNTKYAIPPKLVIDDYKDELGDLDSEQVEELLQIIWDITYQMALMGFGMDSTQLVMDSLLNDVDRDSGKKVQLKD